MKLELNGKKPAALRAVPVQVVDHPEGVVLKRGCTEFKVMGKEARPVVNAILAAFTQEPRTIEDACGLFPAEFRAPVEQLVKKLVERRILIAATDAPGATPHLESHLDIFYWDLGTDRSAVSARLNEKRVAVIGVNYISQHLVRALAASDLKEITIIDFPVLRNQRLWADPETPCGVEEFTGRGGVLSYEQWGAGLEENGLPDVVIATSDLGGAHDLRQWNEFAVANHLMFLPVVLRDMQGEIGPFVVPGETPCYECLRARQNSNLTNPADDRHTEYQAAQLQATAGFHPSMAAVLGDLAAMEVIKFLGGRLLSWRVGHLIDVNLVVPELKVRKVLRVPTCTVCGSRHSSPAVSLDKRSFIPAVKPVA